ncbi:MAG: MBL fold metallo-hydrolase, partial [Polyangiales bacterium]
MKATGPESVADRVRTIVPTIEMLPVRTPTLPPATHTNTFLIGTGEAVLIEPATPYREEQDLMVQWVQSARLRGVEPVAILATHHHPDHVGGAMALRERLQLPLWGHAMTAQRLDGIV